METTFLIRRLVLLGAAWLLACAQAYAAGPRYRVEALDLDLGDGHYFEPVDINARSGIAGVTRRAGSDERSLAVLRGGRLRTLGSLPGSTGEVLEINDRGEIVGHVWDDSRQRPFLWRGGRATLMPLPEGADSAVRVLDFNNLGHAVGYALDGSYRPRPFFFDGERSRYLDADGALPEGTLLQALNDRDEMVGSTGDHRVVMLRDGTVTPLASSPVPPEGDYFGLGPMRLDGAGRVAVGYAIDNDKDANDRWGAYFLDGGRYTLIGEGLQIGDMNSHGWVVGHYFDESGDPTESGASVFRDGRLWLLQALQQPTDTPWELLQARQIDDRGRILGVGRLSEYDYHHYLATPVPEAGTLGMLLAGGGLLAAATRRRRAAAATGAWRHPATRPGRSPMRKIWTAALAALLLSLAGPEARAALPHYRLDPVTPPPPGYDSFRLTGLNGAGLITGYLNRRNGGRDDYEAFILRNGRFQRLDSLGARFNEPVDINERGEVAGNLQLGDGTYRPYLHSQGRTTAIALPADAGPTARAVDVNNLGQVLGVAEDGRAWLYDGHGTRWLDSGGLAFGRAAAFNDRGEVFGSYTFEELGEVHAQPFIWRDGQITLLPRFRETSFNRTETFLTGGQMNNAGQVAFTVKGNNFHTEDERSSYLYSDGGYVRISAEQAISAFLSENGTAVTVAFPYSDEPVPSQVWLYRDGARAQLRDLVPPGSVDDYTLFEVWDVDARGRILLNGDRGALIATPVPEVGTVAMMLIGWVGIAAGMRRRGHGGRAPGFNPA
ncbi:PEP-CTERM sorting domain-containing protein [Azohydromonas aeria]|uniref:PEP-CTERM sorting domain-containing protein n=1 Tax=Azohydromonas aeria TaxID=2590212 RepID=UPI0012FCED41|nr:PEP-CTERM sorting domain-containing protein [Azohydromonas aeria]